MKTYDVHVQFEARGFSVRARNKREAGKKITARIRRMRPKVDRNNTFIDIATDI